VFDFDKSKRLIKKYEYNHVFNQAGKLVTPEFIFLYRQNDLGRARLGMAISKKHIAKAHDRNRLKRLLRESFRVQSLPAVDIVVLARHHTKKSETHHIKANTGKAWEKLTTLCKK
tara:strand:+ start:1410 stop:1754 length:345 start_codon:yes stop_codon:yes gene_type:complete